MAVKKKRGRPRKNEALEALTPLPGSEEAENQNIVSLALAVANSSVHLSQHIERLLNVERLMQQQAANLSNVVQSVNNVMEQCNKRMAMLEMQVSAPQVGATLQAPQAPQAGMTMQRPLPPQPPVGTGIAQTPQQGSRNDSGQANQPATAGQRI